MQDETPTSVTQGISFPEDLLDRAKDAAQRDSRTLSSYIQNLVKRDLEKAQAAEAAAASAEKVEVAR